MTRFLLCASGLQLEDEVPDHSIVYRCRKMLNERENDKKVEHPLSCLRTQASTRRSDPMPSRCEGLKVLDAPGRRWIPAFL